MRTLRYPLTGVLLLATAWAGTAAAGSPDRNGLAAWAGMPVLHEGRIKPVDTYARQVVEAVCGRQSPRLDLIGAVAEGSAAKAGANPKDLALASPELAEACKLFPDGEPRKFDPSELLLSWIIQPQRWERVPFLNASNEELRRELLGLPINGPGGVRLKFASPWQIERADKFHARWNAILEERRKARSEEKPYSPTKLDQAVSELAESYSIYRLVSFRPEAPNGMRRRFMDRLGGVAQTWRELAPDLEQLPRLDGAAGKDEVAAVSDSMKQLLELAMKGQEPPWIPLDEADSRVTQLREAVSALPGRIEGVAKRFTESPPEAERGQLERVRVRLRAMATSASNLIQMCAELHLALFDNGRTMAIVPALNAAALERDRDAKDETQPWLSIQTVLFGSKTLLRDYPQTELADVRRAFGELTAAYSSQEDATPDERLGPAAHRFVAAIRSLGERVEPMRESLPIRHKDEALLAATRYPPPNATNLELRYNHSEPFLWTWVFSLAGVGAFALALGRYRAVMFWLGMGLMTVGQGCAIYGLGLRTAITGRAPVTNMFETVVFVALTVALLGSWFALMPLIARGFRAAWQWTAVPGTWESPRLNGEELALWSEQAWRWGHWACVLPRAWLGAMVLWAFAFVPYGEGYGSTAISLWPRTDVGSTMPTASDLTVWLVGMTVLALCVWYLPRVLVAAAISLFSVPYVLATQGMQRPLAQAVQRKPFAMAGAAVAFLTAYTACNAPIFDQNISPLMPVLRHNFWLTSHVLSITASYGAGALAWGLGNVALMYYLFGRYRDPADEASLPADIAGEHRPAGDYHAPPEALTRRPPEICNTLGTFTYRAIQVAVLLLAAGTILGALWADVSWGRFWGWDPKEVWALVSLLVYLAVLHGRYAGWFGNFGLAVGAVLGATSILMAWYGVNFVLGSGKHSYGEGTGGVVWVLAAVALNWTFVLVAAVRHFIEVHLTPRTALAAR